MRETHRGNSYKPGDYWRECPVCSFDYLRSEMVFRWDGLLVCQADNDIRNPQDTPSYNHAHPPFIPEGTGEISFALFTSSITYLIDQDGNYILDQDGNMIETQETS